MLRQMAVLSRQKLPVDFPRTIRFEHLTTHNKDP